MYIIYYGNLYSVSHLWDYLSLTKIGSYPEVMCNILYGVRYVFIINIGYNKHQQQISMGLFFPTI